MSSDAEFLTLGEVAAYLGWTPRFVERLATGGQLPGVEAAGQWRFRRTDLIDWLDQKIQTLDLAHVAELDRTIESELSATGAARAARRVSLAARLPAACVALDVAVLGKVDVLKQLVALAERSGDLLDRAHLHASLVERESLCSTALPGGVAICHPRRPAPFVMRHSILCFLRASGPVEFGAEDGEPTQFFFLLASIDDRAHLHGLARLVRLLRSGLLDDLHGAPSAGEVVAIIRQRESRLAAPSGGARD